MHLIVLSFSLSIYGWIGYERVSQQKGPQWQREFAPSALATNLKREAEGTAFLPPFLNATCQRGKKSDCSAFFGFRHLNVLIIIRSLRNVNVIAKKKKRKENLAALAVVPLFFLFFRGRKPSR